LKKPITYRPEKEVQQSICDVLKLHRIPYTVSDASRAFGFYGEVVQKVRTDWPDVTAVLPGGRAMFIECKTLTGKPTPGQLAMLELLRRQGAIAVIARSGHEIHELLTELKKP
jgi:hypothetical protein